MVVETKVQVEKSALKSSLPTVTGVCGEIDLFGDLCDEAPLFEVCGAK
jgi:hypothetical protein